MATISNIAQKIVREKPFLEEALAKGLINYAALAENIQEEIERVKKKS